MIHIDVGSIVTTAIGLLAGGWAVVNASLGRREKRRLASTPDAILDASLAREREASKNAYESLEDENEHLRRDNDKLRHENDDLRRRLVALEIHNQATERTMLGHAIDESRPIPPAS